VFKLRWADLNVNAARNLKRLSNATALPVASSSTQPRSDVAHAVSGGKDTPGIDGFPPQEGSGQEYGCAHGSNSRSKTPLAVRGKRTPSERRFCSEQAQNHLAREKTNDDGYIKVT